MKICKLLEQKSSMEMPCCAHRINFQIRDGVSSYNLGVFFGSLEKRSVWWEHQGDGLYLFLVSLDRELKPVEEMLAGFSGIGRIVPFQPRFSHKPPETGWDFNQIPPPIEYVGWRFSLFDLYDPRELRELLITLKDRGAWVKHQGGKEYEIRVPADLEVMPFFLTVSDCSSTRNIPHTEKSFLLNPGKREEADNLEEEEIPR